MRRLVAAALVPALGLAAARYASAEPTREAIADTLFREARQLLEQRQYAEACRKFQASYALDPASGTLLGLAMCHEAEGKIATAWLEYKQLAARVNGETRPDRLRTAEKRAVELEAALSTIRISAPEEVARLADLKVKCDGRLLDPEIWAAPLPVDPGEHVIEVTAPARRPWSTRVRIGPQAETRTITIGPLERALPPEPVVRLPAAAPVRAPSDGAAVAAGRDSWSRLRWAGAITGGVGLLAAGVGGAFALRAVNKNNVAHSLGCADRPCAEADGTDPLLEAQRAADRATVSFITSGALLSSGIVMFWLGGGRSSGPGESSAVAITVERGSYGLRIGGAF